MSLTIPNFDTGRGIYLKVTERGLGVTKAPTSRWDRFWQRVWMALGCSPASMGKVASYLVLNLNKYDLNSTTFTKFQSKLSKYEMNHSTTYLSLHAAITSNCLDHQAGKQQVIQIGPNSHSSNHLDHQAKMKQAIDQMDPELLKSKNIGQIFQKGVLPLYKIPMPRVATVATAGCPTRRVISTKSEAAYQQHLAAIENKEEPARGDHDAMHAARVTLWTQLFREIYVKFGRERVENPVLLAVAGGYHDTARENEGIDYWDPESGELLEHFLERMGVEGQPKVDCVQAVKEKDPKDGTYATDTQRIVHDADCLDIIRVVGKETFIPYYLNLWNFGQQGDFDREAFLSEAKDFIAETNKKEFRVLLEHYSKNYYDGLVTYLESKKERYPLMNDLLQASRL